MSERLTMQAEFLDLDLLKTDRLKLFAADLVKQTVTPSDANLFGRLFTKKHGKEAAKSVGALMKETASSVIAEAFPAFTAAVKRALNETWHRDTFDQLVNNAGTYVPGALADVTEEAFDQMYEVNLKGVFFLTQALVPLMADCGRIVNMSSGLARICVPGSVAYASMKGALEVLTRYLAKELGERGIGANTVAPGAIETDFGGGYIRDNAEANRRVASVTALGRAGKPDDIGPMIASLLSESNRWINAQLIEVAGGMNL